MVQANVGQAQAVIAAERRVDRHYRSVLKLLKQDIIAHPERINTWLRLVNTATEYRADRRPRIQDRRGR